MPDATRWRRRVQELRFVQPGDLADHPFQHRLHSPEQRAHLVGILDEIGIAGGLLAWPSARNGGQLTAIDGHLRKSLDPDVPWPTLITDLTDAEADILLMAYDWIGAQAQSGKDELARLLAQVQPQTAAVQALQATIAEQAGIPWGETGNGQVTEDEAPIDRAAELQVEWDTHLGQLWEIPSLTTPGRSHRLLCGDSTQADDVQRVMAGAQAIVMVTDPPYGVQNNLEWRGDMGLKPLGANRTGKVLNDDCADWTPAWILAPVEVAYVWHASAHVDTVMASLRQAGFDVRQQIIWRKTIPIISRSAYNWQHEPCWYAVRRGKTARWVGGFDQTTVWDAPSPNHIMSGSEDDHTPHPTQKPVTVFTIPMSNHTAAGDICYDPFLGSGTAIVAAEQLGRLCYACDIEAKYVAVSLERLKTLGLSPRIVEQP